MTSEAGGERLQKVLAQHGLGSRREIESWMVAGRILVNGAPVAPGARFNRGDRVVLDGRDVTRYLDVDAGAQVVLYNKAPGEALKSTAAGGESVMSRLPARRGLRWIALNPMSPGDSGLLVLTNDGRLAEALMRRAADIPAIYMVRIHQPRRELDPATLSREVELDGEIVAFESVEPAGGEASNHWLRVVSPRADKRPAVRALFASQGLTVSRLIQVRYAGVDLPRSLPRGRHRSLPADAVAALYGLAALEPPGSAPGRETSRAAARSSAGPRRSRAHRTPGRRRRGN